MGLVLPLKISIITACYNSERTVERSISSVLSQTYKNIEYIIIDGKSTDSTCDIVKKYKDSIHYFISEPDVGIYSALNKGITNATGDYIIILNSDDRLHDEKVIEDVVEAISMNNYPKVLHGKVWAYEEATGYFFIDGKPAYLKDFIYKMNYCTPAAFIKRQLYSDIGLYDEQYKISSDYDWAIRLFKKYKREQIVYYNRIITDFCVGGTSNKYYNLALKEVSRIVKKHFSRYEYTKHLGYINFRIILKKLLPFARKTGILHNWRKVKHLLRHKR